MKKEQFSVTGMTCAACSARVEKAVGRLAGVDKVAVNLLKNSMVVDYDDAALNTQGIINAVVNAGYGASLTPIRKVRILPDRNTKALSAA